MNKLEQSIIIAEGVANRFLSGEAMPHGRSLRHQVKIEVSKGTGGVDRNTRLAAANHARNLVFKA